MTRVVKIGGRVQDDAGLPGALNGALAQTPGGLVVVHGGGDEVSALQRQLGQEPRFVGGRRVTSAAELDAVRMVLSGTANKRLVARCAAAGVRAVGISGEDGGLLSARVAPGAPLGRVGERVEASVALLRDLLSAGWMPIVSPVSRDADDAAGAGLNVNGDDAAAAIATALGASELVFLADVPGVLAGERLVAELGADDAAALIANGVVRGGMVAKLEAAHAALARGVARVRITDPAGLADPARGTALHSTSTTTPWPR